MLQSLIASFIQLVFWPRLLAVISISQLVFWLRLQLKSAAVSKLLIATRLFFMLPSPFVFCCQLITWQFFKPRPAKQTFNLL